MAAGVVVGAVIYHCARSERAKQMKEELMEKLKCMYDHSGECMGRMAEKALVVEKLLVAPFLLAPLLLVLLIVALIPSRNKD